MSFFLIVSDNYNYHSFVFYFYMYTHTNLIYKMHVMYNKYTYYTLLAFNILSLYGYTFLVHKIAILQLMCHFLFFYFLKLW